MRSGMCNKCLVVHVSSQNILADNQAAYNSLYGTYKKRCRKTKRQFQLDMQQFKSLIHDNCHYCGSPPKEFSGLVRNGIDRVDSAEGYTIENCVTCCLICNRAKSDMNYVNFVEWIKIISKFVSSKST